MGAQRDLLYFAVDGRMNRRGYKGVGITDLLPRLNHISFSDQRPADCANMLAEHYRNLLDRRTSTYLTVTCEPLALRRMHSARKRKLASNAGLHSSET
jgi:hypothetical protein